MNNKSPELPYIGVDIGGSHITAAHVGAADLKVIKSSLIRERVASMEGADVIIKSWVDALSPLVENKGEQTTYIGIAMPGPFDYEKGISLMKGTKKYDSLYGLNVLEILAEKLGIPTSHILFRNDAESFLHGELASGAVAGEKRALGITLGTGLGSASNCQGKTVDSDRAFIPFKDSIAEEYISTRWFSKRYKELTGEDIKNVESLLATAEEGVKTLIFEEFGINLATFLNDFIAEEQPNAIVIGGNIAKTWDNFIPVVLKHLKDKNVVLKQSVMWEDAALVGAAYSWQQA
ncbi:ROK family protein [Pedobacter cryoconitis]|uniref:Glucokinase n=1 Tax=Pedobacter cryoconitis TaxID=188932 RepID=A0A7X0J759_9SPHI|nr:ROK family protein [Pedobacter cryoconitis]MBB6502349.1 glucokinase [Pedobacter cryoconitis]